MGPYYDHSVSIALGLNLRAPTPRRSGLPGFNWPAARAFVASAWAWIKPHGTGPLLSPERFDGRWQLESLRHERPDRLESMLR